MSFSVNFTAAPIEYPYEDSTTGAAVGLLELGDFKEGFLSSLFEWSKQDYEEQWKQSLQSLLDGTTKAALITEYVNPKQASKLEWWPLYRVEDQVYIQNHLLFYDQLDRPFVLSEATSFIKDRRTITEGGQQISEWNISLEDIRSFISAILEDNEDRAIATERLKNPGKRFTLAQVAKELDLDD